MKIRNIVTFEISIAEYRENEHPPGEWIALYIHEQISKQGIAITAPENNGDFSWGMNITVCGQTVFFFEGQYTRDKTKWQLVIPSSVGIFKRLFGETDDSARVEASQVIHQVLSSDDRFANIQWYSDFHIGKQGELSPSERVS